MTRLQVLLSEEQARRLKELARKRRTSKTNLVREGIELILRQKRDKAPDPLLDLIGQAHRVGQSDISRCHDKYLAAAERTRNR
jgi:hypothetical protein